MMSRSYRDLVYIPFHFKCGVTAQCNLEVFDKFPEILEILENDCANCLRILPKNCHDLIRRTNLWINVSYMYHDLEMEEREFKHATTHHFEEWLIGVNDRPDKVHGIEIYNCEEYIQNRNHWNGAGLLLHEFCHLMHQLVLPNGLHNDDVITMYHRAMESGKYEEVLRRDWAYLPTDRDTAYATINHKEFFSEISVAFLSFGYRYLNILEQIEEFSMEALSPPFQSPRVLERKQQQQINDGLLNKSLHNFFMKVNSHMFQINTMHCNKFYPFTHEQLESFDSDTFASMTAIWDCIKIWKDPFAIEPCWKYYLCCNSPRIIEESMEERLISNHDLSIPNNEIQIWNDERVDTVRDTVSL